MPPFWERPLAELTTQEWERLCDGCGRCCLVKLEDEETGEIAFTRVACHFLDAQTCRCKVYAERQQQRPGCFVIDGNNPEHFRWLPSSCAYRLRYENKPLRPWHPLLSGDTNSVGTAGVSVGHCSIDERALGKRRLEDLIVEWE